MEIPTSEVDAIAAPVSLDQHWVKIGNHCRGRLEWTVTKQWVSLLEPTVHQKLDWRVSKGIVRRMSNNDFG
jgi:hypothetical protein